MNLQLQFKEPSEFRHIKNIDKLIKKKNCYLTLVVVNPNIINYSDIQLVILSVIRYPCLRCLTLTLLLNYR